MARAMIRNRVPSETEVLAHAMAHPVQGEAATSGLWLLVNRTHRGYHPTPVLLGAGHGTVQLMDLTADCYLAWTPAAGYLRDPDYEFIPLDSWGSPVGYERIPQLVMLKEAVGWFLKFLDGRSPIAGVSEPLRAVRGAFQALMSTLPGDAP